MENEGKDSLGTAGAANANAFDTPVLPPTHPANSMGAPAPGGTRQIFSSPDLAPPTALNAPLPTDPLHPIRSVGTGSGDVRVGTKKPVNKKLVAAVLAGVAVAGIIVTFAVFIGSKVSRPELAAAFAKYRNLVERGPDGYSIDPADDDENTETTSANAAVYDQWALFNIAQSNLSETQQVGYLDNIVSTYDTFLSMTKRADSGIKTELVSRTEHYNEMLKLYVAIASLERTHDKILETLLSGGNTAAAKYIEQTLPEQPKSAMTKSTWEFLSNELYSWENILEIYSARNCLANGEIDSTCATRLYESDRDFAQLVDKNSNNYSNIMQLAQLMKTNFYNQTLGISNLLGGTNAK